MESISFECETCKLRIIGFTNFQRHVNSIEHVNQVQMKISNNVTDEQKVFTSAGFEAPTSTINEYPPSSLNLSELACNLCQKRFSGSEPYKQHLASAGHKKKVEGLANPNSSMGKLRCNICDMDFTGKAPYEQHIVGKAHKKKAVLSDMEENSFSTFLAEHQNDGKTKDNSYSMGNSIVDTSLNDVAGKPIKGEVAITASFVASQLLLCCDVCDKRFSGPVPYQQHMGSPVHKKKVEEKEMLSKLQKSIFKQEVNPTSSHDLIKFEDISTSSHDLIKFEVDSTSSHDKIDGIDNNNIGSSSLGNDYIRSTLNTTSQVHPFRCEDCDKNFNGRVPYEQHMNSALHSKKMLQKKQMNVEANIERNLTSTPKCEIPNYERYFCKLCDKQCTGSIPFLQHIMSEAHCKKKQLLNFNEKLNNLSKLNDSGIADEQMSIDDNCAIEMSRSSSELSFSDVLKEINHVTPNTLNVTTFGVADDIVF